MNITEKWRDQVSPFRAEVQGRPHLQANILVPVLHRLLCFILPLSIELVFLRLIDKKSYFCC